MTREVLGELIISNQESMYRVAKSILFNDEDCKDAIQEAIVKAFSKIKTLKKEEFAKTWLIRILINECYKIHRINKAYSYFEESPENISENKKEDHSYLYDAIKRLNHTLRVTTVLYYIEGYSIKETAQMLKTTESAVKKRLARARKALRTDLGFNEPSIKVMSNFL